MEAPFLFMTNSRSFVAALLKDDRRERWEGEGLVGYAGRKSRSFVAALLEDDRKECWEGEGLVGCAGQKKRMLCRFAPR